jgi:adenine-specific DNA-methyltransferase
MLPRRNDYVIWYAKDASRVKYRQLYQPKSLAEEADTYNQVIEPSGGIRRITEEELVSGQLKEGCRAFRYVVLTKPGPGRRYDVQFDGRTFNAGSRWWGFPPESMQALIAAKRVAVQGSSLSSIRFFDDFPCSYLTNLWQDTATGSGMGKLYVVQTASKVIQRCMLMCTDPGVRWTRL